MSEKPKVQPRRPGQSRYAMAAIGVMIQNAFQLVGTFTNRSVSNIQRSLGIEISRDLAKLLWIVAGILIIVAIIRACLKKCRWAVVSLAIVLFLLFPLISVGYDYWPTSELLVQAASEGNANKVKWCLAMGVDVNQPKRYMLGFDPANTPGKLAETPLTKAIKYQQYEIVKLLVQKGADVNQPDGSSFTPMKTAVYSTNPSMVQLLLDLGAKPPANDMPFNNSVQRLLEPVEKTPKTQAIRLNMLQILEKLEHAKARATSQPGSNKIGGG